MQNPQTNKYKKKDPESIIVLGLLFINSENELPVF
jgi:hypothetical protein